MSDRDFYVELLSNVDVRNRLTTVDACEEMLDQMENAIPHDQMPPHYDWLIARRDYLAHQEVQCQRSS